MYNCTFLIAGAQTLRAPLLRLRDPLSSEHHRPDVDDGQFPGWRVHELRHQGTGLQRRSSGEEVRPFSHINMSVGNSAYNGKNGGRKFAAVLVVV